MKRKLLVIGVLGLIVSACAQPPGPRVTPLSTQTVSQPATVVPTDLPSTAVPLATNTPVPTVATAQSTPDTSAPSAIALEPIVSGLTRPTYLTHAGDARLFVVEQSGRIRVIDASGQLLDRPFLDITDRVLSTGNEQGLLSVAFHPAFKTNGLFFVYFTRQPDGAIVIERYIVSKNDSNSADVSSAKTILVIPHPQATNHNGGQLQFGPDGYLYVGMGDGGGQGDQHGPIGNGQNRNVLLGKLLRLDVVNQTTYAVPPSNPFGTEIWAYGLRNPWRFSFDRATKDLYIADVGQDTYEEVDFQLAASTGGENYGWRIMEGLHCYNPQSGCDRSGLVLPVAEYTHAEGGCAITGGYVYRGPKYAALSDQYFFGDYCSGIIWSLQHAGAQWQMTKRLVVRQGKNLTAW